MTGHTYYLAAQDLVVGPRANEFGERLVAMYLMRVGSQTDAEACDGASVFVNDAGALVYVLTQGRRDDLGKVKYEVSVTT